MNKILLLSVCALSLASCSGSNADSDPNVVMHTDFESLDGWLPAEQAATVTHEKAHSGKYSMKVDANREYSLSFGKPIGQLHDTRPKQLNISAWTFVPDEQAAASLIITISDPSSPDAKPLLWDGIELAKASKPYGNWKEVHKLITVPANAGPNSKLGIYMWRTGGNRPVYADDITVSIVP